MRAFVMEGHEVSRKPPPSDRKGAHCGAQGRTAFGLDAITMQIRHPEEFAVPRWTSQGTPSFISRNPNSHESNIINRITAGAVRGTQLQTSSQVPQRHLRARTPRPIHQSRVDTSRAWGVCTTNLHRSRQELSNGCILPIRNGERVRPSISEGNLGNPACTRLHHAALQSSGSKGVHLGRS
jgi:hypothetical protein